MEVVKENGVSLESLQDRVRSSERRRRERAAIFLKLAPPFYARARSHPNDVFLRSHWTTFPKIRPQAVERLRINLLGVRYSALPPFYWPALKNHPRGVQPMDVQQASFKLTIKVGLSTPRVAPDLNGAV